MYFTFYYGIRLWRCTLCDVYVLKTFWSLTLCAATFCNITSCDIYVMLLYYVATWKKVLNWPMLANMAQEIQMESGLRFQMVQTAAGTVAATAWASIYLSLPSTWKSKKTGRSPLPPVLRIRIIWSADPDPTFHVERIRLFTLIIVGTYPTFHFKCGSNFWELRYNYWVKNA